MGIAKKNRRNLLSIARKHEAEAIAKVRLAIQPEREAVRRDIPFTSWNGFLQHKAEQGNETALAILRSRRESTAARRCSGLGLYTGMSTEKHGPAAFSGAEHDFCARGREEARRGKSRNSRQSV